MSHPLPSSAARPRGGRLRQIARHPLFPFAVLWGILLACHLTFYMGPDDADTFANALRTQGVWNFSAYYYQNWSSRQLLELAEGVFGLLPKLVWRVLNPCVGTAVALCLSRLAGLWRNTQANWVLCGLVIIYPWEHLQEAGWISTTLVYLWPAALGLVALLPVSALLRGQTLPRWQLVLCTLALPYAANTEQMLAFLLLALGSCCLWFLCVRRHVPALVWVQLGICLAMLAYWLACPGNDARIATESVSYFKNFPMLSLLEKLELGTSLTLFQVLCRRDYVFFFFSMLLALAVWHRCKAWYSRALGLFPLVVCTVLGTYQRLFLSLFPGLSFFTEAYTGQGIVNLSNCNTLTAYVPLLLLYGTAVVCVVALYLAFGHTPQALCAILVFVFGLGTRVVIGFSPTVGISGHRTALFFSLALIGLGAALYALLPTHSKAKWWFTPLFAAYCALQIYSVAEM